MLGWENRQTFHFGEEIECASYPDHIVCSTRFNGETMKEDIPVINVKGIHCSGRGISVVCVEEYFERAGRISDRQSLQVNLPDLIVHTLKMSGRRRLEYPV